ncbi:MAG: caspase family protein [Tenuifilaceae bacterium]|nr:caspase family protein [Tenuifilaceae bacterium]
MKQFAALSTACLLMSFIAISTSGKSQSILTPELYQSITPEHKIPLFIDEFVDNKNNWLLGIKENVWFQNLENNSLFFQSYEDVPKEDFKEVYIDQSKDFEIELKIRLDKGIPNKFNGLQWGKCVESAKQFDFFFNGQGQYTIDKFENGKFTDFVPITSTQLINNYTYNKLTVRKLGENYYFFLNEQLVHKMPFEPLFGHGVGFQVAERSSIQIEYLKVWQLNTGNDAQLPSILITNEQLTTPTGTVTPGATVKLSFTVSNTSSDDAKNLKLLYTLPQNVLLLESISNLPINAGETRDVDMLFYINREIDTNDFEIVVQAEGAEFAEESTKSFAVEINKPVQIAQANEAQEYTLYRSGDPLRGLMAEQAIQEVSVGRYFALIIGIDKYSGTWTPLRNAVNDARAVAQQLSNQYEFHTIKTLFNEQATRSNIIKEFEWLMTNVRENDNLLIFYSGHGEYNEALQRGFWVPVDANTSSISQFISNIDIQTFLGGIKSKHTFLIADACFSGDIFRGKTLTIPYENSFKYYNKIYSKPSRTALTSGGIEPVMDGGKEGHSVFTYYLLRSLTDNRNQFFDASQLYNDLKIAVINNSNQTPMYSPIINTGDEGGQLIFIRKKNT